MPQLQAVYEDVDMAGLFSTTETKASDKKIVKKVKKNQVKKDESDDLPPGSAVEDQYTLGIFTKNPKLAKGKLKEVKKEEEGDLAAWAALEDDNLHKVEDQHGNNGPLSTEAMKKSKKKVKKVKKKANGKFDSVEDQYAYGLFPTAEIKKQSLKNQETKAEEDMGLAPGGAVEDQYLNGLDMTPIMENDPTVCRHCNFQLPRLTKERFCRKCGKLLRCCVRVQCRAPRLPWDKYCNECAVQSLPGDVTPIPEGLRDLPQISPSWPRVECSFCGESVADPFEDSHCRNCGKNRIKCPKCGSNGRFPHDQHCHSCGTNFSDPANEEEVKFSAEKVSGNSGGQNSSSTCVIC